MKERHECTYLVNLQYLPRIFCYLGWGYLSDTHKVAGTLPQYLIKG